MITCLSSGESEIFSYLMEVADWNEKLHAAIEGNVERILIWAIQTRSATSANLILDRFGHLEQVRCVRPFHLNTNEYQTAELVILKKEASQIYGRNSSERRLPLGSDFRIINEIHANIQRKKWYNWNRNFSSKNFVVSYTISYVECWREFR